MKIFFPACLSIASAIFVFLSANAVFASPEKILLSEIQIGSEEGGATDDFAELYNPSKDPVDISEYRLRYRNSSGKENSLNEIPKGSIIPGKGFFLWANSNSAYAEIADTKTGSSLAAKYSLALLPPKRSGDTPLDSITWENAYPFDTTSFRFSESPRDGESLTRDISTLVWSVSNTPTPTNSHGIVYVRRPECVTNPKEGAVRINEFLANAKSGEQEFIELYNPSESPVSLRSWKIKDKNETYTFKETDVISPEEYFVLEQVLTLNDSGSNRITLIGPTGDILHEICYSATKDGVSSNYFASGWRGGKPTPRAANSQNSLPET